MEDREKNTADVSVAKQEVNILKLSVKKHESHFIKSKEPSALYLCSLSQIEEIMFHPDSLRRSAPAASITRCNLETVIMSENAATGSVSDERLFEKSREVKIKRRKTAERGSRCSDEKVKRRLDVSLQFG